MDALFGQNLENQQGEEVKTTAALDDIDVVGIYFSAHWCPPCRGFTPVLGKKYQELKDAGKKLEIVFASSDSDAAAFKEYAAEQPWIRLPYAERAKKEELSTKFGVRGIPTLVFLDAKTGETITTNGRGGVSGKNFIAEFPYHPKPCYDLSEDLDGIDSSACLIIFGEAADKATQDSVSAMALEVAVNEKKLPEAERRVAKIFTALGGGPTAQIRKGTSLPAEAAPAPTMVILNLPEKGAYYTPAAGSEEVNAANIDAFLTAFKTEKLTRNQWVQ